MVPRFPRLLKIIMFFERVLNMAKKIIAVLTLLLLLSLLISCNKKPEDPQESDSVETSGELDADVLYLVQNGICDYRVVRPDGGNNSAASIASSLRLAVQENLNVLPAIVTDYESETAKEILIGETNRSASKALQKRLENTVGYAISVMDEKIVICATSENFLKEAVENFIATYLVPCRGQTSCTIAKDTDRIISKQDYIRQGWLLQSIPAYEGGELSSGMYSAGAGLLDDHIHDTEDESYMQVVSQTSKSEFRNYLERLERNGFEQLFTNTVDNSVFYEYYDGKNLVYTYFNTENKEVRVIWDRSGIPFDQIDQSGNGSSEIEFYQYQLNYCEGEINNDIYPDCGMFYIFRLQDNSLFIIDGGHPKQATDEVLEKVMTFFQSITGSENVTVRAWFITHAHGDHAGLPNLLLQKYSNQITLQMVMANVPCMNLIGGYSTEYTVFLKTVQAKYPLVPFLKLHTGMSFSLGGVQIDVLYTHEDAYNAETGSTKISHFNDSSTVIRVSFGGKRVLFLGDAHNVIENTLIEMYQPETLQADMVQIAHHGINQLNYIYRLTNGTYALVSNSEFNAHLNGGSCEKAYNIYSKYFSEILYEMNDTYRFTVRNGELVLETVN